MNRIPGSRLLISSLPGSALRAHVKWLSKPRNSTSILEALPGNLDIKRHSPSILYIGLHREYFVASGSTCILKAEPDKHNIIRRKPGNLFISLLFKL